MPTIDDVRKTGEQARAVALSVFEQAKTPLLAAIGAGEVATQAVLDAVSKARGQVAERAEATKAKADGLPSDLAGLRDRLDPAELRKLVDSYSEAAGKLYSYLAEEGEKTVERLRTQPQFKKAVEQFDQAARTAQQRAEAAVEEARELADDVLGKVVRRTRSTGEQTAVIVEAATEDVAEAVVDAGAEAADEVRTATRKTAAKTTTAKRATAPKATAPEATEE